MIDIEFYKAKAKELGLSQYRLAKMCGIYPQQINACWTGRAKMGSIMESKLIKALNVEVTLK